MSERPPHGIARVLLPGPIADRGQSACEAAGSQHSDQLDLVKKAIVQKGRDNTRIPIPVGSKLKGTGQ